MSRLELNDVKLSYMDKGSGFPIVLLHGLSDSSQFWEPLIDQLSKDHRTLAFDLRGHGGSGKTSRITMELFTNDLEKSMEELGIEESIIIGFSLGALISLQYTLNNPNKVKSLILLSSYSQCKQELYKTFQNLQEITREQGVEGFFDKMVSLVYTSEFKFDGKKLLEYKEIAVKMNSAESLIRSLDVCKNFNVNERLDEIKPPTLIFCGNEDILIPPENSEELNRGIKNSKLIKLSRVGHNIMVPEKVDQITSEIVKFLK